MASFDKYKNLYNCDFNGGGLDISAYSYSQIQLRQKEQEHKLQKLFEFIKFWKEQYELFCHEFNSHSWTEQRMPLRSAQGLESGVLNLPKSEFYIDGFFNEILNKRAKFEIQYYVNDYNIRDRNRYIYSPASIQNIIISSNRFTLVGDINYRLDIKLNTALICSLIVVMSNNYTICDWYSKGSRFKEFIDSIAKSHYFIEFKVENKNMYLLIHGSQTESSLRIDIQDDWLYFILPNEILRIENRLYYNHLDKIFGLDRKKPLDEEDLQLYSILNEGKKPTMYDFEF